MIKWAGSKRYALSRGRKISFSTAFCLLTTAYGLLFIPVVNAADTPTLFDIQALFMDKDYAQAKDLAIKFAGEAKVPQEKAEAYYYEGVSELWLGHYASARQAFSRVQGLKPSKDVADKASIGMMDAYYMEGDYKRSLDIAENFLHENPKSEFLSSVYLKVARCHLKLANWKKGQEYLQKVVQKFPDSLERFYVDQLLQESQYFAVQVGSFTDRYSAEKLTGELVKKGEYAYIVEAVSQEGKKLYRVRVGKLQQFNEAQKLETRLSQLGYPTKIYP